MINRANFPDNLLVATSFFLTKIALPQILIRRQFQEYLVYKVELWMLFPKDVKPSKKRNIYQGVQCQALITEIVCWEMSMPEIIGSSA